MKISLKNDMVLVKVFNNNIILVKSSGREKILFEKGIGFGKKFGAVIKKGTEVEKIFIIENEQNIQNFNKVIERTDEKLLGLFEEKIQNPFLIEIETLYPLDFYLAEKASRRIEKEIGVNVPDGEIGFIALHIHSARNNGKLSNTVKYSYLGNIIIKYVEDELNIQVKRRSLDYARFLTHMRFAIERIITKNPIENDLRGIIKSKYKKSYKISEEIGKILSKELNTEVSEDEIAYIAMHIERFKVSFDK